MAEATDDRLRLIVERIERLKEEQRGIADDIRDVFAEAKAVGYDTRILRQLIARRAMKPDDRAEADAMLEAYETALGGNAPDPAVSPDEVRRELALALLSEQIEGVSDPEQASALAEHISVVLDLRAEIALLRTQESERKKLANQEGFDSNAIAAVARWIEKCVKHGSDAMRAGEAVFHLYRGTVESRGAVDARTVTDDPKLQALMKPKSKTDAATDYWLNGGM